jgi:hypothetical protein
VVGGGSPPIRAVQAVAPRGLTWPTATGERVGATATNRDWPASAEGQNLAADKIEVAHAIEVGVICDAGCAIAGAELDTEIELNFRATIGRVADKCATGSPLIDRKMATSPPPRPGGRQMRRSSYFPWVLLRRTRNTRRSRLRAQPPAREPIARTSHELSHSLRGGFRPSARCLPRTRGPARSAV